MATMKYIGARYMPKFMGTYDATTAYEALSVVDNGAGTTYVANKPAPAGTPLSNTDYWSIYGASSGAILDLQNRMQTAESDINTLQGDISSIESDLNILTDVGSLKGKTIAIFGASNELASYTQGVNWVDLLSTALTGYATVINKSVAGQTLYDAIDLFINDADHSTYDICVFCCTKNLYLNQIASDIMTINLDISGIENRINLLSGNKTASQIFYFATCTPFANNRLGFPMCLYDGRVVQAAAKHGYKIFDMHSWLGVSDSDANAYTYDGVHFKAEVAPIFASRALKALFSGGDQVIPYSAKLYGNDLIYYLAVNAPLGQGVDIDNTIAGTYSNMLYFDSTLRFNGMLYLKNNNQNSIQPQTYILDNSGAKTPVRSPAYGTFSSTDFYGHTFTLRASGIRAESEIPAGGNMIIPILNGLTPLAF